MTSEIHSVRPGAKRNGISLTLVGVILLFAGIVMFITGSGFAPGLVCFSFGAVGTILGLAKVCEPDISVQLSTDGMTYFHRRGKVFVAWDNIQRIDVPRVTQGFNTIELSFVALKLKQINPVLDNVSPRLATGLLTEQRPLLMTAAAQDDNLDRLETYLGAEFTPLVVNGERYRGVLAMFGHRCEMLNAQLGYHLYIPQDSLDRDANEFVKLLRQYKASRDALETERAS